MIFDLETLSTECTELYKLDILAIFKFSPESNAYTSMTDSQVT